jgi:hypothetical protein
MHSILDRRSFIRLCSAAAAFMSGAGHAQVAPARPARRGNREAVNNRKNFVAIQVRGFGWVDEGVDAVLDNIQNKGDVNTVWAYTFGYGETRLKATLPDHGKPGTSVTGGAFYDYDPKYFQNTILKDFRSSEYGKFNVIEEAAPKAKARGLDFFAWDLNNAGEALPRLIPNYGEITEIDGNGRRLSSPCFNHPDYQAFLRGKVESLLLGYPSEIDGIAWGSERVGPLDGLLGGGGGAGVGLCFCQFCQAKGRALGISVARAQAGFRELGQLFQAANTPRPADGYFVSFWRILLKYPEILSWESLWSDSFQAVQADLYGLAKSIAPQKPFGFHILQTVTFSPFYRAEEDYAKRRTTADFLKIATYNNAGGPRMATYVNDLSHTIFRDAAPKDFLELYYKIMGIQEAPFDQLASTGLSPDYVAQETKRALAAVGGEVKIYPGIDIDVPTLSRDPNVTDKKTKPEDVKAALRAAFGAGADGVVLSREYVEMWLANLTAAGDTLRDIFAKSNT